MKTSLCTCITWCFVILLCSFTWSATLRLRNGKTITGDIITKTDNFVVLKTAVGVVTQQWRVCSPTSIKALHPALYQRLVKEAQERKKKQEDEMAAKGMVKVNGKWISKSEHLKHQLAKIRLFVDTTETADPYERISMSSGGWAKDYQRKVRGVLCIKLDGLDNQKKYNLKILYTHHAVNYGDEFTTDQNVTKEFPISKEASKELRVESTPFKQRKTTYRGFSGTAKDKYGSKSLGWDISIWLDGTLIYEAQRDADPKYHHVQKW